MEGEGALYRRVEDSEEIRVCLEALMQHSGASLLLDDLAGVPLPVLLEGAVPGDGLLVDISSSREAAPSLMRGAVFRLVGQSGGKLLRSGPLRARLCREIDGAMLCDCEYPDYFEAYQRRHDHRVRLAPDMECEVRLEAAGIPADARGRLLDLSMSGCRVEFSGDAVLALAEVSGPLSLCLTFPNGLRFSIEALLRHHFGESDQRFISVGFHFLAPDAVQDRSLWYFVREIEREAARRRVHAGPENEAEPSVLFREPAPLPRPRRPIAHAERMPPALRGLAHTARFLAAQMLALRGGGNIDGVQLSREAERLLGLLDRDREALLFALTGLRRYPLVLRHCLSVAVRLVDLAGPAVPRDIRKVMMASAMIHDFGKVLLPPELLQSPGLDAAGKRELRRHVELLRPRLAQCRWLTPAIMAPVLEQANERLDGSGYPRGLRGGALRELARMMAVVDVADAMGRARPDRPPRAADAIARHLLGHGWLYEQRWVRYYLRHFGRLPIGTPLRFASGELAWVKALGAGGEPVLLQRGGEDGGPPGARVEDEIGGHALAALGNAIEILPAELADGPGELS